MEKNIVTTIDGIGTIVAANDRANFTVTIKAKSDELVEAVGIVNEKMVSLKQYLKTCPQLDGEIAVMAHNYKLEHREGGEKYDAGFQSVYTITFTVAVDESLNDIYQNCLKYDSTMYQPYFTIKDRETLLNDAVELAAKNVEQKLETECGLLGVNPKDLSIFSWHFGYDGTLPVSKATYTTGIQGATGPQGPIGSPGQAYAANGPTKLGSIYQVPLDAIKLNPGTVFIKAAVQVSYVWK